MELFLTPKLILKGSYAFVLFLKWISLQMKEIYKMTILEEIIPVLILGIDNKQFSTKFNRNKNERIKGHFHRNARPVWEIPFNDATKVCMWDFRWNSNGYLGSSSTARVTIFQRELFETLSLTKHSFKKFDVLPMSVILTPAEVYDTYVEIDKNMLLDVKIYNSLIQKPKM